MRDLAVLSLVLRGEAEQQHRAGLRLLAALVYVCVDDGRYCERLSQGERFGLGYASCSRPKRRATLSVKCLVRYCTVKENGTERLSMCRQFVRAHAKRVGPGIGSRYRRVRADDDKDQPRTSRSIPIRKTNIRRSNEFCRAENVER